MESSINFTDGMDSDRSQLGSKPNSYIEALNCDIVLDEINGSFVWLQRLGYILEHADTDEIEKQKDLLHKLRGYLVQKSLHFTPLATKLPIKNEHKNNAWKIIENTTIESDL